MPFVFENYIDIQKEFRRIERKSFSSISDMAEHFKEFQLWSNISKMKIILLRLRTKKYHR
jgi:hypothetical protein